jgi:hypothetical protein
MLMLNKYSVRVSNPMRAATAANSWAAILYFGLILRVCCIHKEIPINMNASPTLDLMDEKPGPGLLRIAILYDHPIRTTNPTRKIRIPDNFENLFKRFNVLLSVFEPIFAPFTDV